MEVMTQIIRIPVMEASKTMAGHRQTEETREIRDTMMNITIMKSMMTISVLEATIKARVRIMSVQQSEESFREKVFLMRRARCRTTPVNVILNVE